MRELTYLIYLILWEALTIGGCCYVVFILDHSGWWFLLAIFLSCSAIQPKNWFQ